MNLYRKLVAVVAILLFGEFETWEPVDIIPLMEAQVCEDCGNLTRAGNCHCICCGSHATSRLSKWLHKRVTLDLY